jgi:salicylate biosynthesis isochorismate synthase/menaquinone-specific isochorismate synthase
MVSETKDKTAKKPKTPTIPVRVRLVETQIDMLSIIRDHADKPLVYWEHPDGGEAMLGIGEAIRIETSGESRLHDAATAVRDVLDRLDLGGAPDDAPAPVVLGGFSFGDSIAGHAWREFAPCRFVLAETTYLFRLGRAWCFETDYREEFHAAEDNVEANGASSEPAEESDKSWDSRVRRSLARIDAGDLDKIVLSRSVSHQDPDFDLLAALDRMRTNRTSCATFCVKPAETAFFGSTPEMLLHTEGNQLKTQAMAGTIAHGIDPADERDRMNALRTSAKDRREHQAVVGFLKNTLEGICTVMITDPEPAVVRYPEAMHLRTRIHSRLRAPAEPLELAALIHPTPAVCGVPQDRASQLLADEERARGWYTGSVGWIDADGTSSLSVALRSALLSDGEVTMWAGAGIVSGSDPAAEREEVELKLNAVRAHLTAAGDQECNEA